MATLRDAYTAGRLTLEEFDERTSAAYESKTWGDLRKLTEDLPSQPILGADVPGRRLPVAPLPAHPERGRDQIPPARRRPGPGAFFPIVALWLLIAVANRGGHVVVGPLVVLIVGLAFLSLVRRKLNPAGLAR